MTAPRSEDWREDAYCAKPGVDPDIWFTEPRLAKEACRHCPVVLDCLTWALDGPTVSGVVGGLTERERRALRKKRDDARKAKKVTTTTEKKERAA